MINKGITQSSKPQAERSPLFTYIDSKEYDSIINENNVPRIFGRGGIFICLKGEGYVIINEHKYQLSPGTLCIAFPGTIIQGFKRGEGFESYTLRIATDFLRDLAIPAASSIHIMMRENPCMVLEPEQLNGILDICHMMQHT